MIHKAQEKIFLLVQAESFANKIKQLKSEKKMVPESSGISHLDPFLDNRGILRVGWRLRKSNLTEEENHPVILPKKCVVSNMIIQWSHRNVAHGAWGMTLNHLRQRRIWIVNANAIVQHLVHKCTLHKVAFDTLLYATNYVEKWDTKRWQTYHRKDARKQLHSYIVV